tara:strand:- start:100164 stop:101024 length:861 start_codon:yes stop_codon:yes gene_type:complete
MTKLALFFLNFILVFSMSINVAHSCAFGVNSHKTDIEESAAIFIGQPINCSLDDEYYSFLVLKNYKGPKMAKYQTNITCNIVLEGQSYLIYGRSDNPSKGEISTSTGWSCSKGMYLLNIVPKRIQQRAFIKLPYVYSRILELRLDRLTAAASTISDKDRQSREYRINRTHFRVPENFKYWRYSGTNKTPVLTFIVNSRTFEGGTRIDLDSEDFLKINIADINAPIMKWRDCNDNESLRCTTDIEVSDKIRAYISYKKETGPVDQGVKDKVSALITSMVVEHEKKPE